MAHSQSQVKAPDSLGQLGPSCEGTRSTLFQQVRQQVQGLASALSARTEGR